MPSPLDPSPRGEHLEHARFRLGRESRPAVAHRYADCGRGLAGRAQPDVAAARGVARGVVEEVGEALREAHRVAPQPQRLGRQIELEPVPGLPHQRPGRLDRAAQHFGQLHRLPAQLEQAAADARGLEQVVHQPHQVVDLPFHHAAHLPFPRRGVQAQQLQPAAQRRERIAQLVGEHGDEVVLAPIGLEQRRFRALALDARGRGCWRWR